MTTARVPVVAVPTLDALAERPELAASLPTGVRQAFVLRALTIIAACATVTDGAPTRPAAPAAADDLLDVDTAARRLGMSRSWLYRNARRLPFTVPVGSLLRFDPRGIARYIADRAGAGA